MGKSFNELIINIGKLKSRIWLLNEGSEHYLNFLRNLTPQIALLSVTMVLYSTLDFSCINFNNWMLTLAFFMFLILFMLAFFANIRVFVISYEKVALLSESRYRNSCADSNNNKNISWYFGYINQNRIEFSEVIFIGLSVTFFYIFTACLALAAAANILKLFSF